MGLESQFWTKLDRVSLVDNRPSTEYLNNFLKIRIQETKHLSTNADSSPNTKKSLLLRQNSLNDKLFLRGNFTPFMSKSCQI